MEVQTVAFGHVSGGVDGSDGSRFMRLTAENDRL